MSPDELDVALEELETRVERLRALYEQYFIGIEKVEPLVARKDVDRRIWLLRREQIRNTGKRFRLQMTIQRYNTFQQYWMRICREIENGTYVRHLLKAQKLATESDMLTIAAKKRFRHRPPSDEEQQRAERAEAGGFEHLRLLEDELADALDRLDPLSGTGPRDATDAPAPPQAYELDRSPAEIRRAMDAVLGPSVPPPPFAPAAGTAPDRARRGSVEPLEGIRSLPPVPRPATLPSLSRPPRQNPSSAVASQAHAPKGQLPASAAPSRAPATAGPAARQGPEPTAARERGSSPGAQPATGAARPSVHSSSGRGTEATGAGQPGTALPRDISSAGRGAPGQRTAVAGSTRVGQGAPFLGSRPGAATSLTAERVDELHARLVAAKQQTRENSSVTLEGLKKTLAATEAKLRAQHGAARRIEFDVVIRDGKAVLKPIVR